MTNRLRHGMGIIIIGTSAIWAHKTRKNEKAREGKKYAFFELCAISRYPPTDHSFHTTEGSRGFFEHFQTVVSAWYLPGIRIYVEGAYNILPFSHFAGLFAIFTTDIYSLR